MIEYDPTLDLFRVNGVGVTTDLVERILTKPWQWEESRKRLTPTQRAAIDAAVAYVEGHGFPKAP